jgi:hypothetical protein
MNLSYPKEFRYVDTKTTENPNSLGESLRYFTFKCAGDEYGCYSSFMVADVFEPIKEDAVIKKYSKILGATEEDALSLYKYEIKESDIPKEFKSFCKPVKIIVAWYWDGDGVLYFEITENNITRKVINTDCKKSYEWNFN